MSGRNTSKKPNENIFTGTYGEWLEKSEVLQNMQ